MSPDVVCRASAPRDEILPIMHDPVRSTVPIAHVTVQLESEGWETSETHL